MLIEDFIVKSRKKHTINFFCDLETYQYNEKAGYDKPSQFKNQIFSLAVSYIDEESNIFCDHRFYDFKHFFDITEKLINHKCKIKLFFHNGNGYDNHYLLFQLLNEYNLKHRQMYVKQVTEDKTAIKIKDLSDNMVLEKRVKASTNLELAFRLANKKITYVTVDTLPKTGGRSLRSLGYTMYNLGLIEKDTLKSDFNYTKYNLSFDLSYKASKEYAKKIHEQLNEEQLHYIDNDVILLANVYKNYTKMYPGFDFDKITFSQNILQEYKISKKANFQLTGKIDYKRGIKYSDYDFRNENFFDYLKHYYKGGLNFYNDEKIGKIIYRDITSLDINSSYPYVMYNFKIPYKLIDYSDEDEFINIKYNDNYYMYEISDNEFNRIVALLPSKLMRKLVTKYYNSLNKNVYINTNTLKLINMHAHTTIKKLHVISWLQFDTEYFAARNIIAENYAKKTQGKNKNKVDCSNLLDIKILSEKNTDLMSPEEYAQSKVILNGIYGLPALRPYYNYFRYDYINDSLISVPKGFSNTERNQLFSIFITSQAFFNLLEPLKNMSGEEIDKYLYYGDTDSLYIDNAVIDKVPNELINDYNLGSFKKEHQIQKMYILNHKKYAFQLSNSDEIIIHAGGVPLNSFNLNMSFEKFVNSQFHSGVTLKSTRNYRTDSGTIAIYQADMKLEKGLSYPLKIDSFEKELNNEILNMKISDIDENVKSNLDDLLYIESPFGSFSFDNIVKKPHNITRRNLRYLKMSEKTLLKEV